MITFSCPKCGRSFSVSDEAAGRSGKCKACGTAVIVPKPAVAASDRIVISFDDPPAPAKIAPLPVAQPLPPSATKSAGPPPLPKAREIAGVAVSAGHSDDGARKLPMRTRRLLADAEQVRKAFRDFPLIRLRSITGDPPDCYQIEYFVRGLQPGAPGIPEPRNQHVVEIQLTSEYPRQSPKCKALTPAFHPNIDPVAICVGDHWTAAERLVDLIVRIGEILAYQAYNVKSPLDVPAALWAEQHADQLPTDSRELRPPDLA